jgi:hypothetical protein
LLSADFRKEVVTPQAQNIPDLSVYTVLNALDLPSAVPDAIDLTELPVAM